MAFGNGSSRQAKVKSYASVANFPNVGKVGAIYQDTSVPSLYLWDGSEYISASPLMESGGVIEPIIDGTDLDMGTGNIYCNELSTDPGGDSVIDITDSNDVVQARLSSILDSFVPKRFGVGTQTPSSTLHLKEDSASFNFTQISGTVDVTNGDPNISGTTTSFTSELVRHQMLRIEGVNYEIDSITSDTALRLKTNYAGSTDTGLDALKSPDYSVTISNENNYNINRILVNGQTEQSYKGTVVLNSGADLELNTDGTGHLPKGDITYFVGVPQLVLTKPLDMSSVGSRFVGGTIVFAGCDRAFTGTIPANRSLILRDMVFASADGLQQLFDVTLTNEFSAIVASNCVFRDFGKLGNIKGSSSSTNNGVVGLANCIFSGVTYNFSEGLKLNRVEDILINGAKFKGGDGTSKNLLEINGGVTTAFIQTENIELESSSEFFLKIDRDTKIEKSISVTGNSANLADNFFAAGSQDTKNERLTVRNNEGVIDNTSSGKVFSTTSGVTTFPVIDSWSKINATYVIPSPNNNTKILASTNGCLKYIGDSPDDLSISSTPVAVNGSASLKLNTVTAGLLKENKAEILSFYNAKNRVYQKNNFVPANDTKVRLRLFSGGVIPTGLSASTVYWVVNANEITEQSGVTFNDSTNLVLLNGHGFSNNDRVAFRNTDGSIASPLEEETSYWVINANVDDFQVSLTQGGAAIVLTDTGTGGTNYVYDYDTYRSFQLSTSQGGAEATFTTDGTDTIVFQEIINEVTFNTTTNVITDTGHPFVGGELVMFRTIGGTLPAEITELLAFYVRDVAADTYKLEYTSGGGAVDLTGSPSGITYRVETVLQNIKVAVESNSATQVPYPFFDADKIEPNWEIGMFCSTKSTPTITFTVLNQGLIIRD